MSIRIMLVIASIYDLHMHQMDVKITFLNWELEEEIYIDQQNTYKSKMFLKIKFANLTNHRTQTSTKIVEQK